MSKRNTVRKITQSSYEELLDEVTQLKKQNSALETELLETKRQLEEQSCVFEHIITSSKMGYWDWHLAEDYAYLSPGFKQMFGYSDDELPNHPAAWQEIMYPNDLPAFLDQLDAHVQSKSTSPFDIEVRYYHKDGHMIDICCRGQVVSWDNNGQPLRMIVVSIDISKVQQAERALAEAHEEQVLWEDEKTAMEDTLIQAINYQNEIILQLEEKDRKIKEIQQLTRVGYWTYFLEPAHSIWSLEVYTQFGLNPREAPPIGEAYYNMIHPEDVAKTRLAIEKAKQNEAVTFEQRVVRPDHTITYLKATIKPWRDEEGNIIGIYGGSVDVTDIKTAQEEIARSEALQKIIFNSSLDALFITDSEKGIILDCNERAVQLFEFDRKEDFFGKNGNELPKRPFSPEEIENIRQEIMAKGSWSSEVEYKSNKGRYFWGNLAITGIQVGSETMGLVRITDITERVRLSEILSETQRMAIIGGWEYEVETRKMTWTDEMYRIYELPIGTDISLEQAFQYCDPENQEQIYQGFNKVIKNGGVYQFESELVTVRNKRVWIRVIARAHQENKRTIKLSGTFQNIDVQKKQELLLQSKKKELRTFIEAAPAAIAMFDQNMCYVAVSEKWYEDYQLLDEKILGNSYYDIFPDISEEWKEVHQRCLQGIMEKREEDKFERVDGTVQWLKWEVRPWYDSIGEIGGIIMFTEDITDWKKQEEELVAAKKRAEEASLAKAQFLSTMSHEIRTPMNAVIGMTHILLQEDPKPDQIENLHTLRFSAENLLSLINNILDFSKIEAGKIELEQVGFSIRELAYGIKRSLAFNAEEKGLKLKVLLDEDIPEVIMGDPTRLSQILNNLLSNAIKFTEKGSVTLTIEVNQIQDTKVSLHMGVRDTGIGIAQDKVDRIFESFSQADIHTTRKYGGTGLGLAITKHLLELFGSNIQVESRPGEGTRFYFDISFNISKDNKNRLLNLEPVVVTFEPLPGYRVLLVEDNQMNVLVASRFLNKWGLTFDHAQNGKVAVELACRHDYDLILMDLQMPEMDGFEATEKIKALGKQVPIIALTASAMQETQEKILKTGMDDLVTKPFNPNELYQKIRRHLVNQRQGDINIPYRL